VNEINQKIEKIMEKYLEKISDFGKIPKTLEKPGI